MEKPICTGTTSRSCSSEIPTFTFSLFSSYLSITFATRFVNSLAVHRFFPLDSSAIVFCLPRSVSASLMCRRAGRYCCLLSLSASGCTLERSLCFFSLWQTFHHLNIHFHLGGIFQNIFHCIHHPFFPLGSIRLSAVPGLLSRHHPSLAEADESCLHVAFHFLWCSSIASGLTTTNLLGPSVLRVSTCCELFRLLLLPGFA